MFLAIVFLLVPGIKIWNLDIFGFSLGRFQPFKFAFIIWFVFQGLWLVRRQGRQLLRSMFAARSFLFCGVILFFGLFIGLAMHGGGERGWQIFTALWLGAVAAMLTALDDDFPVRTCLRALLVLALFLFAFVLVEQVAFDRVEGFLNLVRDGSVQSFQAGSTLSPSALAALCVRALPIVLLVTPLRWMWLVAAGLYTCLGLFTLTRGTLVAISITWVPLVLKGGRKMILGALIAATITFALIVVIMGPAKVYGRYLGWLNPSTQEMYSASARNSANERVALAKSALIGIQEFPLTGLGLNGFLYRLSNNIPPFGENKYRAPLQHHTHNLFLEVAVSGGIPAFIGLVGLFMIGFGVAFRDKNIALGFYLTAVGVDSLLDARIYVSWLSITLFWFAAIAWQAGRVNANTPEVREL